MARRAPLASVKWLVVVTCLASSAAFAKERPVVRSQAQSDLRMETVRGDLSPMWPGYSWWSSLRAFFARSAFLHSQR